MKRSLYNGNIPFNTIKTTMLRPRLRIPRCSSLLRRPATQMPFRFRPYHTIPTLPQFKNPDEGVPGLLSPEGFHLAWTEYMEFVINKLNGLTSGTSPFTSLSIPHFLPTIGSPERQREKKPTCI